MKEALKRSLLAYLLNDSQSMFQIMFKCLLLNVCGCCEDFCHSAYRGGSPNLPEVRGNVPTIVPVNFTGVVTIEAAYIPGYTAQYEYIRFMKNDKIQPLVMQFFTPNGEDDTTLKIFSEDKLGPHSLLRVHNLFNDKNANIIFQVSDVHVTKDKFYRIYLDKPGEAHITKYSYQDMDTYDWDRLNTTTQLKTDNKAVYFRSVSVCSEDTPVLCGGPVETVAVSGGGAFNLSCLAYGAPFLEAVWSNQTAGKIYEQPVYSVDGFLHTANISIGNFSENHLGEWKCHWRNKNLGSFSTEKIFYVVELVSKPSHTNFVKETNSPNNIFKWAIKHVLSDKCDILLECKEENSALQRSDIQYKDYIQYGSPATSELSATLFLPGNILSNKLTCTLYLITKTGENKSKRLGVLDTTALYKKFIPLTDDVDEETPERSANFDWKLLIVILLPIIAIIIMIIIYRYRKAFRHCIIKCQAQMCSNCKYTIVNVHEPAQ